MKSQNFVRDFPVENWTNAAMNLTETGPTSKYSTLHIVITCIVVVIIMLEIVLGNILVIIAIVRDKNLKARQNWLIASLSVADLCVGCLIMPLSLTYELMGYWSFGVILCDMWLIIDVMLCTASVLNLCVISLDRYWCVTRPLTYPQKRTPKRMAIMIALSWGLSAVICLPPVFGWKSAQPQEKYPQCHLSQQLGYILYSISGSFFAPLIITCAVYAKVLYVARSRARRNIPSTKRDRILSGSEQVTQVMMKETSSTSSENHDSKNCKKGSEENGNENGIHKTLVREANTEVTHVVKETLESAENDNKIVFESQPFTSAQNNNDVKLQQSSAVILKERRCPLVCCILKRQRSMQRTSTALASMDDSQKMKRRIAKARERRATVTVGLIVFSFALCWLPFSLSYVIDSIGGFDFQSSPLFTVFFWLGYVNSGINPLLYTFFNRDFRTAFKKILHLQ